MAMETGGDPAASQPAGGAASLWRRCWRAPRLRSQSQTTRSSSPTVKAMAAN